MMPGISEECNQLGIDESEGEAWPNRDTSETGAEEMTDEEIIGVVVQGDDDSEEEEEEDNITQPTVTHTEAEAAFSICMSWLEQQDKATPMNLMLLCDLHLLSSSKKYNSLKQRTITDYFKPA